MGEPGWLTFIRVAERGEEKQRDARGYGDVGGVEDGPRLKRPELEV